MTNTDTQEREAVLTEIVDQWLGYKALHDEHQYHMPGRVLRELFNRAWSAATARMAEQLKARDEEIERLLSELRTLYNMTCDSYKELADQYAPGLHAAIKELAALTNKEAE